MKKNIFTVVVFLTLTILTSSLLSVSYASNDGLFQVAVLEFDLDKYKDRTGVSIDPSLSRPQVKLPLNQDKDLPQTQTDQFTEFLLKILLFCLGVFVSLRYAIKYFTKNQNYRRWVIPIGLLIILVMLNIFRWDIEATKTMDKEVVKWKRDRWTGELWLHYYGVNVSGVVPTSKNEAADIKYSLLTNTWRVATGIVVIWLTAEGIVMYRRWNHTKDSAQ